MILGIKVPSPSFIDATSMSTKTFVCDMKTLVISVEKGDILLFDACVELPATRRGLSLSPAFHHSLNSACRLMASTSEDDKVECPDFRSVDALCHAVLNKVVVRDLVLRDLDSMRRANYLGYCSASLRPFIPD
jgi:hypothetical protein